MKNAIESILQDADRTTLVALAKYAISLADDESLQSICDFAEAVYCPKKRILGCLSFKCPRGRR